MQICLDRPFTFEVDQCANVERHWASDLWGDDETTGLIQRTQFSLHFLNILTLSNFNKYG